MLALYRALLDALQFRPQKAGEPDNIYLSAALAEVAQKPLAEQSGLLDLLADRAPAESAGHD